MFFYHLHHIDGDNFYWLAILRVCGVLIVVSMLHVYASYEIILARAQGRVDFTHDLVLADAALRNTTCIYRLPMMRGTMR
jgi:hypothetical protein